MTRSLISAALAAVLALPLAAQASGGGDPGATKPSFDGRDRNRDGFISRDEARDAEELHTRFTELDRNNDGKLSREEYGAIGAGASGATTPPPGKGPGAQESATRPLGAGSK